MKIYIFTGRLCGQSFDQTWSVNNFSLTDKYEKLEKVAAHWSFFFQSLSRAPVKDTKQTPLAALHSMTSGWTWKNEKIGNCLDCFPLLINPFRMTDSKLLGNGLITLSRWKASTGCFHKITSISFILGTVLTAVWMLWTKTLFKHLLLQIQRCSYLPIISLLGAFHQHHITT